MSCFQNVTFKISVAEVHKAWKRSLNSIRMYFWLPESFVHYRKCVTKYVLAGVNFTRHKKTKCNTYVRIYKFFCSSSCAHSTILFHLHRSEHVWWFSYIFRWQFPIFLVMSATVCTQQRFLLSCMLPIPWVWKYNIYWLLKTSYFVTHTKYFHSYFIYWRVGVEID